MTEPELEAVLKDKFGSFALDVTFKIPLNGITGIFGPSGCGKTTMLRCIAGLQRPFGKLIVAGEIWQNSKFGIFKKVHERSIGYTTQEDNLFPHLSVKNNLLYGTKRLNEGRAKSIQLNDLVNVLGINALLDRSPLTLSGGEKQRVSIGRAIMSQPRLLLLDEPLSALDQSTKARVFTYLKTLCQNFTIPALYVSHDINELRQIADRIILMENGKIIALE